MSVLLNANVLSELRKGPHTNANVRAWMDAQDDAALFISAIALAEIRDGIERLRPRDPRQAARLERWLIETQTHFAARVLPVTAKIADRWGRLHLSPPLPDFDRLMAATAIEHGLEIATRNTRDFERAGVSVVNPWLSA